MLSKSLTPLLILSTASVSYVSLSLITNCATPVVVVDSGSMEPTFQRGDVLFLWNQEPVVRVGDVAVCWFEGKTLPMVHRVMKTFSNEEVVDERYRRSGTYAASR